MMFLAYNCVLRHEKLLCDVRIVKNLEQNHASLFRLDFSLGEEKGNLSFFNLIVMIIMMNYVYMKCQN